MILITGAAGQLGQALVRELSARGLEFTALSRQELDITQASAVDRCIAQHQPKVIINAAAYNAVDQAETYPAAAFAVNQQGPANLARAAQRQGAALFHISTDYVFAGDAQQPYTEADNPNPQTQYGKSKLAGERAVAELMDAYLIIRTAWVFSAAGNNFIKLLLKLGLGDQTIKVVDDKWGNPTYAGDLASHLVTLAQRYLTQGTLPWGLYHCAGMPGVSRYQLAQAVYQQVQAQQLFGFDAARLEAVKSSEFPSIAQRPAYSQLNCNKIQRELGLAPSHWQAALANLSTYLPQA